MEVKRCDAWIRLRPMGKSRVRNHRSGYVALQGSRPQKPLPAKDFSLINRLLASCSYTRPQMSRRPSTKFPSQQRDFGLTAVVVGL